MPNQSALTRQLGLTSATALVIANMVGTGIFTTTGFLAGDLGIPWVVLLIWAVGGVFALLGAFCYSELAINFPISGGEYVYLSEAYGPTWGFLSGWVSFFAGFSAPIAAAALAFASYVRYILPGNTLSAEPSAGYHFGWQNVIACLLVAAFSAWNIFGVVRAASLQNVLTSLKLVLLICFVVSGFVLGQGDWENLSRSAVRWSVTPLWRQFIVSLFWVYVAYSGWNAATYVAEEVKNPRRILSQALTIGTLLVGGLYLALNLVFLYAVPLESMKGVVAVGALACSRLFGPHMAGVFSALMAACLLSTVSAMTIAGPRVYYAMARNHQFFSAAAKVHPRWRTPVNSILAQAACAMLLVFTPFAQLVIYIGFTLNLFAVMAVASLFRFRRRRDWIHLPSVSFGYPLVPSLFVAAGLLMTLEGLLQKPVISLLAVLTLATGALLYHSRWAGDERSSREKDAA